MIHILRQRSRVPLSPYRFVHANRRRVLSSGCQGGLLYDRDTGIISDASSLSPMYQSVIGIEIHAQLTVPTKLFSSAPTKHHPDYNETPNTSVTLHDLAYPGTLPIISRSAVQKAVISSAALNCELQYLSRFERKHYSYADLPLGYQVTQQRWPIAKEGVLTCRRYHPLNKKSKIQPKQAKEHVHDHELHDSLQGPNELSKFFSVGIDRVQIEQDTGKTTTISTGSKIEHLIDFNRAGSTLIEIVFKPQIRSAHEAASVVSTLQSLLKYLDTCDGKLEEGSLRCDLNVSIAPIIVPQDDDGKYVDDSDNPFQIYLPKKCGHRVEVKNLNSIRQIILSTEFEAKRQYQLALSGNPTGRETRTFDPKKGETIKIRDKGGAVDYRFMPEPDLPPLILKENILCASSLSEFLRIHMPELPEAALTRLMNEYGLSENLALIIVGDRFAIYFYENAVKVCLKQLDNPIKSYENVCVSIANWLCNDLFALIKESATTRTSDTEDFEDDNNHFNHPVSVQYSNVDSFRLASLVALVLNNTVSTTQAKKLLGVMYYDDRSSLPLEIAEKNGWKLITSIEELKTLCRNVVLDPTNGKQLDQYKKGGKHVRKMTKFFTGKVMAEARGNAHPEKMGDALLQVLEEIAPGVAESAS